MKKLLLLASAAMLTAGTMAAAGLESPKELPNRAINKISQNGEYAASYLYGTAVIMNLLTGDEYVYTDEISSYDFGNGNFISNTGVLVGQQNGAYAAIWQDGEWSELNDDTATRMSLAAGITLDGTRIVGCIAPESYTGDYEGLMMVPCYWDVNSDGTFGQTNYLPYPQGDFIGRTPQYITAVYVSADGKTIAGQITDFGGGVRQPIVYTCDASGKWSYSLPQDNLYHIDGFVIPEDPGEAPEISPENFMTEEELAKYNAAVDEYFDIAWNTPYPELYQFMTDEEWAAYSAALEEYYETWENYPEEQDYMTAEEWQDYQNAIQEYYDLVNSAEYPNYQDYMTEEEWAQYQDAQKIMDEWDEKWNEFSMAYQELCTLVPSFTFNNVYLSADGTKMVSTLEKDDSGEFWDPFAPKEYHPWVFDLTNESFTQYRHSDAMLIVSSMADDGTLYAQKPATFDDPETQAYILPVGSDEFMPIYDYFTVANPSVASWIKDNLTRTYIKLEVDEETWDYVEKEVTTIITGMPFVNGDKSILALSVENTWDYDDVPAFTYLIPTDYAGIGNVVADAENCKVMARRGGVINLVGEFASVAVYDIAGRAVFSTKAPASIIETGLGSGAYVIKATTARGNVIVSKVAF